MISPWKAMRETKEERLARYEREVPPRPKWYVAVFGLVIACAALYSKFFL